MPATSSSKSLNGRRVARTWPPCTRARPTIAAPLLLLHFTFGTARRALHSFIHSPSLSLPLPSPPRRSPRCPEPCPPWPAGTAWLPLHGESGQSMAAAGHGQDLAAPCTNSRWPKPKPLPSPLFVVLLVVSSLGRQGPRVRIRKTTQGSRCEAKTHMVNCNSNLSFS